LRLLVAGGTGLVGAAIVRALASSDVVREIVVTSRSEARLAALLLDLGPLAAVVIPLVVEAGASGDGTALRAAIERKVPNVDAAIASLGAGEPDGRRLVDLSRATFDTMMAELLGAHVAFATAALPLLTETGTYLGIGGGAAYAPMPGGGAISIAAAAQVMMTRVLAAENDRPGLRIRELVIDAPVVRREEAGGRGAIAPDEVGTVVEELLRTGSTTRSGIETNGSIVRMRPITVDPS
jgi:NAD(P)-dependent dehydrogenase (short-subunit alcohol dehydrogenase family)